MVMIEREIDSQISLVGVSRLGGENLNLTCFKSINAARRIR